MLFSTKLLETIVDNCAEDNSRGSLIFEKSKNRAEFGSVCHLVKLGDLVERVKEREIDLKEYVDSFDGWESFSKTYLPKRKEARTG